MKYLRFTMENGEVWDVPAKIIAESRAKYYFESTMEDEYECADWAQNNMNWCDFDGHAIRREDAEKPDYQEIFANADTEFIEVEGK